MPTANAADPNPKALGVVFSPGGSNLVLEGLPSKWFYDVAADAAEDSFGDLIALCFGGEKYKGQVLPLSRGADPLEEFKAGHFWHVPIGDDHGNFGFR